MSHPLALFNYCPRCGSSHFVEHDARAKRCLDCGFTYYHNASAATVAVIFNARGELLVTRRAFDPARGTLDLPGGFVDPLESLDEGCRREVREETGGEAVVEQMLFSLPNTYHYSGFDIHTADAFFLCHLTNERAIAAADDAEAIFWIPLKEVRPEAFGLQSVRMGVERILRMVKEKSLPIAL